MLNRERDHWSPAVAAPARNEAERLPALLQALNSQTWMTGGRRLPVHLVLNNSDDGSAEIVAALAPSLDKLVISTTDVWLLGDHAHVGTARRLAMDGAVEGLGAASKALVLTTDADATPHRDWVAANIAAIAKGADAVGGLIIGDALEEACLGPDVRRRAARHLRYAALADQLAALVDPLDYDPWPRHRDHTGASLAIRADVYRRIGGLPETPFREDLALVSRLRAADYRIAHPLSVKVGVSARLVGRAPGGMADCLRSWIRAEAEGAPHLVEAPVEIHTRLLRRRALRCESLTPGEMIERWADDDPDAFGGTPVEAAIAELEFLIAQAGAVADVA